MPAACVGRMVSVLLRIIAPQLDHFDRLADSRLDTEQSHW